MKLITKGSYKFVTGMFWQIPDDGRRKINLNKLIKDTKHNMVCQVKKINPTWGFCHREELQGEKKVASLGKFIIEASGLSASYANSIICYKFKNAGELDEDGLVLDKDLYGYIVLLNGTICPNEGEYVANFAMVKESIIQQAKNYEIETLYLPLDVAGSFFSIFEILLNNFQNQELLTKLLENLTILQRTALQKLINEELSDPGYNDLLSKNKETSMKLIASLVQEPIFEAKLKETSEQGIKYLIPNIYTLALTSEEVYWKNESFKKNFTNALIWPINKERHKKYKVLLIGVLLPTIGYMSYKLFNNKELPISYKAHKTILPTQVAVIPVQLISKCLGGDKDRFFKDLGNWTLISLKCNSLGSVWSFNSETNTTLSDFTKLIGKTNGARLKDKTGIYAESYPMLNNITKVKVLNSDEIVDHLQNAITNYGINIRLNQGNKKTAKNKFEIISKQSPLFLLNHGILDNTKLSEIDMTYDSSTGFYNWVLKGEF